MASSRSWQPEDLTEQVRQLLAALAPCDDSRCLTVALSGGLDSTVLLCLLAGIVSRSGWQLRAVHIHHGLSGEADAWLEHCARLCARLQVPFQAERVRVETLGRGLEDAARAARYAALRQLAPAGWIVLAHHADDQAETLLHRLVRGTGVTGAAAMHAMDPARRLWRPLLAVPREQLCAWAETANLAWVEDASNADEALTRNFIRHRVLPPLKSRFPAGVENIARACRHFEEAAGLLDTLALIDGREVGQGPGSRDRLCALGEARMRNLLRYCLNRQGLLPPSAVRLEELVSGLCCGRAVRWIEGPLAVCAYHASVWLEPSVQALPEPCQWISETELPWGAGKIRFVHGTAPGALRLDPSRQRIELGLRQGGEVLQLGGRRPHRGLKVLCQDAGIPSWWRNVQPLLWVDGRLAWAGRLGADASMLVATGESGWAPEWIMPVSALMD